MALIDLPPPRLGIGRAEPPEQTSRRVERLPASAPAVKARIPRSVRILQGMTIFFIFGQRLSIPFGSSYISWSFVLAVIMTGVLYRNGVLVEDRTRTRIYIVAMALCLLAALTAFVRGLPEVSISSVMLLVAVYAPFCFVVRPDLRSYYGVIMRTFCSCMVVIAAIAILQLLTQVAGVWTYKDLFAAVVPHQFVVSDYETAYPIKYGSALIKSNGLFCLEPSFCSQLLGLAIVVQLVMGTRRWRIALYAVALVATVSGTGLLLLGAGLAVQMVRRGLAWSVKVLMTVAFSIGLAALTPSGQAALARVGEVHSTQSSGNQRFLAPYQRMWNDLGNGTAALFLGNGPGFADREAELVFERTGAPAISPPISKLLTEYGLFAGVVMILAIGTFLTYRTPSITISLALLVFYFFLSSSLLQGQTVYMSWLFASIFGISVPRTSRANGPERATTDGVLTRYSWGQPTSRLSPSEAPGS